MGVRRLRCVLTGAVLAVSAISPLASAPSVSAAVIPVTRNIVYRTVDGVELKLDVYRPPRAGTFAAVLVVHGGSWRSGDKPNLKGMAYNLARAGFVAFVANYRLAPPKGTWHSPAPVEDLLAAVSWVRANGAAHHADGTRVGAIGPGAGGHLALMLATTGVAGGTRPDAAASYSGPTDLTAPGVNRAFDVVNYIGCTYQECPDAYVAASPRWLVDGGDAPLFLAHAEDEFVPVAQARSLAQAAADAGLDHELHVVPGSAGGRALEDDVWPETVAFFRAYLAA